MTRTAGMSLANAEDRGQEGPPPPRDVPAGLLLSGAHLRRAEEAQAGLELLPSAAAPPVMREGKKKSAVYFLAYSEH
jgi:hypothetical protein